MKNILEEFVAFWDEWHREWHQLICCDGLRNLNRKWTDEISKNNKGKKIIDLLNEDIKLTMVKGLPLIREKFNDIHSAEVIPEPYWGKIDVNKNLSSIFININPFLRPDASNKLYNIVFKDGYDSFSTYVSSDNDVAKQTTQWLKQKRGVWFYNLQNKNNLKIKNKTKYNDLNIDQLLSCDIVPWHTPKKNNLSRYLKQESVIKFISEHQIDRIAQLAKEKIDTESPLHNKVIVRSSVFIDYINTHKLIREKFDKNIDYFVIQSTRNIAKKFSSYLTIVKHIEHQTRFYIFTDGVSMELPDVNYMVHQLDREEWSVCTLRDFIQNDKDSPNNVQAP
jgi:hypothetical protein